MEFQEFMAEEKTLNRWSVLKIGLMGAFCGALIATLFVIISFIV